MGFYNNTSFDYLKRNFDQLAQTNYTLYSRILKEAEKKAVACESIYDTVRFLELAKINTTNIEFQEYFSETIENLLFQKPKCFLDALIVSDTKTQEAIIAYLKYHAFHEPSKISKLLTKYRKNRRYKKIINEYFGN